MLGSHQLLFGVQQQPTRHGCPLKGQPLLELGQLAAAAAAGLNHKHLAVAAAGFDEITAHQQRSLASKVLIAGRL